MTEALRASDLAYGYQAQPVVNGLDLSVAKGEWVGIVGPNGSGKSTVLRMLARLLAPQRGTVWLEGQNIARLQPKSVAKRLTMLAQSQENALDMTVRELVRRGRNPHLRWYEECRGAHEAVVDWAIAVTGLERLQHRSLPALSGGERQRAWLAMSMAQTPETLLLDEPTTYLDIAHQLELMELIRKLNVEKGITVVMVIHDLNQAARYCSRIVAVKQGAVVAEGAPAAVFRPAFFRDVFGIEAKVFLDDGVPVYLPCGIARS
ncbi:ABC transporter ATP-binding protein [Paenibacillus sp. MWE-103]|uniref:ABC transporter ATP-binding protein n=1 Tax=Paenibacillus artemisiicola TaxID=1172618 RepID=A0ABS3W883_9BACL|nr:ABC transporter ATP-binding protein [Paenibacillus artemisiicola]MBO7744507.1 ABC transporter ATP-binding protein [Paenibacillus artemisiicola]